MAQNYSDFEYIIIDGNSTDNSVNIIRKYESRLSYWVSEPDKGQTDAINKGFSKATGEILYWLNSDDVLLPGTFQKIAKVFNLTKGVAMVYGDRIIIDENGKKTGYRNYINFYKEQLNNSNRIAQETAFFKRSVYEKIGELNNSLQFCMDREYWVRISKEHKILHIPFYLGIYRDHQHTKSNNLQSQRQKENDLINKKYFDTKFKENKDINLIRKNKWMFMFSGRYLIKKIYWWVHFKLD